MTKLVKQNGLTTTGSAARTVSDAADLTYDPLSDANWNSTTDPGDLNDAVDQLAARVKTNEDDIAAITSPDASVVTYSPVDNSDWNSSTDPGNVDDALDQLADRLTSLSITDDKKVLIDSGDGTAGYLASKLVAGTNVSFVTGGTTNKTITISVPTTASASDISYAPNALADWDTGIDPGNVDDALDQLADRVDTLEAIGVPDASIIAYTASSTADWNGSTQPGEIDDALDQLADRVDTLETSFGPSPDASGITYTPLSSAHWDSATDPGDVNDALDQLASRLTTYTTGLNAANVAYAPVAAANWNSNLDPGDVDNALDQLAARIKTAESTFGPSPDAANITYTAANNSNWNSSTDPGDVNDALDQLADRVKDTETAYAGLSATSVAFTPGNVNHWNSSTDPGQTDDALDQLASRVQDLEDTASVPDAMKVLVSATDTTEGYLLDKIVVPANTSLSITRNNVGADEEFQINDNGTVRTNSSDVVYDYLINKIVAGSGATVTAVDSGGGDYVVQIAAGGAAYADSTTYVPTTSGDWSPAPDDVEEALDQLATRVLADTTNRYRVRVTSDDISTTHYLSNKIVAGTGISVTTVGASGTSQTLSIANTLTDAASITYTPASLSFWDSSTDPGDVDNALDQLAHRVWDLEDNGTQNSTNVAYYPAVLSNWNSSADPGMASDAFDQLAARVKTLETSGSAPDAAAVTYTPTTVADWDSGADPGDVDNALDQIAARVKTIETSGGGSPDASVVTYTPTTAADWNSSADPGDVDEALDQIAARVKTIETSGGGSPDAADVTYTPVSTTDWTGSVDPGDIDEALDQLASRMSTVEGVTVDAADVTYTPTTSANWNASTDPGDVDEALDQLAERVDSLEIGGTSTVTMQTETLIATGTLSSGAFTFASIPQGYDELRLVIRGRSVAGIVAGTQVNFELNSDTTATNYATYNWSGGTDGGAYSNGEGLFFELGYAGFVPSGNSETGRGNIDIHFLNYSSSTLTKEYTGNFGWRMETDSGRSGTLFGQWENTSAVTQIHIYCDGPVDFSSDSEAFLYGIKESVVGNAQISITDGTTTVNNVSQVLFNGSIVANEGSGVASVSIEYPKRATMWHADSIATVGNAVASSVDTGAYYGTVALQDTPSATDEFTNGFYLLGGSYTLMITGVTFTDRGIIDWYIDDVLQGQQDWSTGSYRQSLSVTVVGNGWHVLKGKINGTSTSDYYMVLTQMTLFPASD